MVKAPGSRERSAVASQQPEPPAAAADVRWGLVVLGATLAYPLLESRFWSRALWGANALAFLPPAWWLVPLACALLFVPRCSRAIGERLERVRLPAHAAWAWVAGLAAAAIVWLLSARHLHWGAAGPT